MDEPVCMCDHQLDEHDEDLACLAEGCPCSYYDPDEDDLQ